MNQDMKIGIRLEALGWERGSQQIGEFARTSTTHLNHFTKTSMAELGHLRSSMKGLWSELNGFSTASKLIAAAGGAAMLKDTLDANLAFERTMLQLKWNAQMTKSEISEIRKLSLEMSRDTLNTPQQMGNMFFRLGNAGLKMATLRKVGQQIAPAAQVFGTDPDALADMAFDMVTKSNIKEDRIGKMLNMMYYHATSGRFETSAMAREAPKLLNAGAAVGITGEEGLNLMGALTQRLMRRAVVSEPSMVSTIAEEGLAHLTMPHYQKGLQAFGIDIKTYFDNKGHFKGDGGVDGLLELTRAMKKAHLDNPFNLGKAGFREKETRTFWLEMMASLDADDSDKNPNLIKMMERGRKEKEAGTALAANLQELKNSAPGKAMAAAIEVDKAKLGQSGYAGTNWFESAKLWMVDNKKEAALGLGGALIGGRLLWNKFLRGGGAEAGAMGEMKQIGTRSTASLNDALGMRKQQFSLLKQMRSLDVEKSAMLKSGALGSLKFGAPIMALLSGYSAWGIAHDDSLNAQQKHDEYKKIAGSTAGNVVGGIAGGAIGGLFGGFGAVPGAMIGSALGGVVGEWMSSPEKTYKQGSDAIVQSNKELAQAILNRPLNVNVNLDGKQLSSALKSSNSYHTYNAYAGHTNVTP